jgi:signal transduction histidine kinase
MQVHLKQTISKIFNRLANIFDPFVRGKEDTSSMGLGLAIYQDILI